MFAEPFIMRTIPTIGTEVWSLLTPHTTGSSKWWLRVRRVHSAGSQRLLNRRQLAPRF